jgi:hypothetical protein
MTPQKTKYERALELPDEAFKLLTGVSKATAKEMAAVLNEAYQNKHKRRGRHGKLSVGEMLMLVLEHWRQYPTMFELGFEFGVAKSTVHTIIVWVEDTLIKSGLFALPGKKALLHDSALEVVLVDATESPVERPKKSRKNTTAERRRSTR